MGETIILYVPTSVFPYVLAYWLMVSKALVKIHIRERLVGACIIFVCFFKEPLCLNFLLHILQANLYNWQFFGNPRAFLFTFITLPLFDSNIFFICSFSFSLIFLFFSLLIFSVCLFSIFITSFNQLWLYLVLSESIPGQPIPSLGFFSLVGASLGWLCWTNVS